MHEVETFLSAPEFAALKKAAEMAGMSLDDFVTHAARTEFRARYVLPKIDGKVIPFRGLKRGNP